MGHYRRITYGLLVALGVAASGAVSLAQRNQRTIPVIVVYNDDAPFRAFTSSFREDDQATGNPLAWGYLDRGVVGVTQNLERGHDFRAEHVFSSSVRGFSARLTIEQIRELEMTRWSRTWSMTA